DGFGGGSWQTMEATHPQWIKDRSVVPLVQFSPVQDDDLKRYAEVPILRDVLPTAEDKAIGDFLVSGALIGRSIIAPPGVPEDRIAALRAAFDATMQDPDFRAEARKLDQLVTPMTGAELEAFVDKLTRTPQHVIDKAAQEIKLHD